MEMVIRRFREGNEGKCCKIAIENWDKFLCRIYPKDVCDSYKSKYTEVSFKKCALKTDVWILELENEISGFAVVRNHEITRLFIRHKISGKGLGSILLNFLKYKYGWLKVESVNHPKVTGFYEKNGFIERGKTKIGVMYEYNPKSN